jgi:hexulose-6-phosphate isomerase
MLPIGIMQGRLVPPEGDTIQAFPRRRWSEEFAHAAQIGMTCIEWIYDVYGEDVNPIASEEGIARMKALATDHAVVIRSLCADYFMEQPLLRVSSEVCAERLSRLVWLLERCSQLGIERVVLPFVDNAAIHNTDDEAAVITVLRQVLPTAEHLRIELHLETALGPQAFRALLDQLPSSLIKVNYDSGNSASLGYRSDDEFAAYGERIGSVHIKDRRYKGGTTTLGTGDADLPAVVRNLKAIEYRGDLILQVARGDTNDEVAWNRHNRQYIENLWAKVA